MKKKLWLFLAFFAPILILGIYVVSIGGNFKSTFINDLNEQYIFLFDHWKQILNGKQSLFYSFSISMGQSFIGTYAYYLASPFNWLFFFIPEKGIFLFLTSFIFIKIGLCSFNMFLYLKNTNHNKETINFIFSLCYALMGFNMTYYFNIMWLDVVLLTPLVILGLEKLIKEGKNKLYIITLFISIMAQYYMAFMLCIFCVVYFIHKAYILGKLNKETIKKFILSSLFAGFLTAFFTIPVFFNLTNIYRDNIYNSIGNIEKLSNFLISFGIRRQNAVLNYNYPVVYCGFIQIVLLVNFLLYTREKKKTTMLVLLFFLCSILLDPFIFIWHGGSYPYGFHYRFSFLISFFLLSIAASHFSHYQPFPKKIQVLFISMYAILLTIGYLIQNKIDLPFVMVNTLFLYANITLLNINKTQKNKIHEIAMLLFVVLELIFQIKCTFALNENLHPTGRTVLNNARFTLYKATDHMGDNTTRIEGGMYYYDNELLPMNKGNITLFLSTNNQNIFELLNNSGQYVAGSYILANPYNYFLNSLLGVRYWYGYNYNPIVYQNIGNIKVNHIALPVYENPYALSLGYLIEEKKVIQEGKDPFQYQNDLVNAIIGKNIFQPLKSWPLNEHTYEVTLNDKDIYLYIEPKFSNKFSNTYANIYINDQLVATKKVIGTIFHIKNKYKNQTVKIKLEYTTQLDYKPKIYFYEEDVEENLKTLKSLQQRELKNVKIHKNKLEGMITTEKDSLLLLTIPYEKGFTVQVDGRGTSYEKIYNAFVGIQLSEGTHKIEIQYDKPYGIKLGIAISSCTLLLFGIHKIKQKGKMCKK